MPAHERARTAGGGWQPHRIALAVGIVAIASLTVGLADGTRPVMAAVGTSAGHVFGTGTADIGGTSQTVTLDVSTDGTSAGVAGTFSISNGTTAADGSPTCVFIGGTTAVIGIHLPGPGLYGLMAITDNDPGVDTMWLDTPVASGPVDCTTSPSAGSPLTSGNFTVATGALPPPTPDTTTPPVDPGPVDANGDGIDDGLQPAGTPAGSFLDASLSPPTYGSIIATDGLSVRIVDSPDPAVGVVVIVGSEIPGRQAELSVCGGFSVLLDAGTSTTGTCGSVTLRVTAGSASIVLADGLAVVSIPAGGAAKVASNADGSYSVANLGSDGAPSVGLTVDGTTATIAAGTTAVANMWQFVGFQDPIDNGGVLNRVKAGQAIPVKWRVLDRAGGATVGLSSARITVASLTCASAVTIDQIEEVASGSSGLQDLGDGYYQVNWKTPASYANSCKTMRLDIGDGVTHDALFQFVK